jgi:outer membrane usher protein
MRSRWIDSSFALVEVSNVPDVQVFANNQFVAKTNDRGLVVIPTLVPYQPNKVRLDDEGIAVDINLDLTEKAVVPRSKTGLLLKFVAHREIGATLILVRPDNTPLPLGTQVSITGTPGQYEVYMQGEVFIPGLSFPARVSAKGPAGDCELTVMAPATAESLPQIGPLICVGAK